MEFPAWLQDAIFIFMVALPSSWIGGLISSYHKEKGKNLATKEDISEITSKVEEVKQKLAIESYKSTTLIERQIFAFDQISKELAEIQIYCIRSMQGGEHAVPYEDLPQKSTFQRAVHLSEISHVQRIFLNKEIWKSLNILSNNLSMLGHAELAIETVGPVQDDHYNSIRLQAKTIMGNMRDVLFSSK